MSRKRRFHVGSFGETMWRLAAPRGRRLEETGELTVTVGGAESNVCAALAALGRRCAWTGRLPASPLGRNVLRKIRAAGVDTSGVRLVEGERLGLYFVEFGAAPRPTEVHYDRTASAAARTGPDDLPWETLLDSEVLHLTGITPALGSGPRELVRRAISLARDRGVAVSLDVNYRAKLWTPQEAAEVLGPLSAEVDLLVCGRRDAELLFGASGSDEKVLALLEERCPGTVILTLGEEGAVTRVDGAEVRVAGIPTETVDRFGAGDAFSAGVIDGYLDGDVAAGLRRGVALAALALSQHGDAVSTTREEVERVMAGAPGSLLR